MPEVARFNRTFRIATDPYGSRAGGGDGFQTPMFRQVLVQIESRLIGDDAGLFRRTRVSAGILPLIPFRCLRASSLRWPRNSCEPFTVFGQTGGALGAPWTRSHGSQPSCFSPTAPRFC